MVVYVDVLLVVNFIVNYFLLLASCRTASLAHHRMRMLLSALLGAGASLVIFFPYMGVVPSILYKLLTAAIMVRIAFTYTRFSEYCKQLFMFFAVTFLFGGAMLGVSIGLSPKNMIYYNGIVYFDISAVLLVITTAGSYAMISLFSRIFKANNPSDTLYTVIIEDKHNMVTLKGMMDTGNHLKEPFSDTPVIITDYESVKSILPLHIKDYLLQRETLPADHENPMRMIPYMAVDSGGLLPAFVPYKLYLIQGDIKYAVYDVYVAVAKEKIGSHNYDILLNPDLIKIKL